MVHFNKRYITAKTVKSINSYPEIKQFVIMIPNYCHYYSVMYVRPLQIVFGNF